MGEPMGQIDTQENPQPSPGDPAPEAPQQGELAQALAAAQEHQEAALRARADLENARRRHERELQNALRYGAETLIGDLLPVRDSLEEALRTVGQAGAQGAGMEQFIEGTRLTLSLLDKSLERAGLTEVPTDGRFDPAVHQAVAMRDSTEVAEGHVLEVVQKGFALKDRLVRPAMVIVARAPATPPA